MAHPRMFDDADATLARVRGIARELPGAAEKVSHGRPAFYTKKVFAYYGGSVRGEEGHVQRPASLILLLDRDERRAMADDSRCFVPAYLGPSGWLGIDLDGGDWCEVAELIESSFRQTAPARLVAELGRRTSG